MPRGACPDNAKLAMRSLFATTFRLSTSPSQNGIHTMLPSDCSKTTWAFHRRIRMGQASTMTCLLCYG